MVHRAMSQTLVQIFINVKFNESAVVARSNVMVPQGKVPQGTKF